MDGPPDAAVDREPRERTGLSFDRLAIGLLFVAVAFRALLLPAQNDTYWHLRAGADIWRTGHAPLVDTYSFTAAGLRWPDHEWLWQLFLYGCHRLGGMPLCNLAAATCVVATVAIVYRLTVGPRVTRFILLMVVLVPASCAWALRPQIVTLLALCALVGWLARDRYRPIPFLFLVWANLHGGVMLGGIVLVGALLSALWRWWRWRRAADRRRLGWLALVIPLSGVATCATPLGLSLFRFVREGTSQAQIAWITEWQPTLPNGWLGGAFWLVALAFAALCIGRRRALLDGPTDGWADWVLVAATCALFPLACRSLRNIAPCLMLAAPAASRLLGVDFHFRVWWRRADRRSTPDHPRLNAALLAVAGAGAAGIVAVAWATAAAPLDWRPIGGAAQSAVRACDGPLYNRYDEGGYLIWFTPEKKVFIDSRHDPYPLAFQQQAIAVQNGEQPYQPLFARWGIGCAFLPQDAALVGALQTAGWSTRYRDAKWAVLTAPNGPDAR